jgi:hypothetical protein
MHTKPLLQKPRYFSQIIIDEWLSYQVVKLSGSSFLNF